MRFKELTKKHQNEQLDYMIKRLGEYEDGSLGDCEMCLVARSHTPDLYISACTFCILNHDNGHCEPEDNGVKGDRIANNKAWYKKLIQKCNASLEKADSAWRIEID